MDGGRLCLYSQMQHSLPRLGEVLEHTAGAGTFHFHQLAVSGIGGTFPSSLTHSTLIAHRGSSPEAAGFRGTRASRNSSTGKVTIFHVLLLSEAYLRREREAQRLSLLQLVSSHVGCKHVQIPLSRISQTGPLPHGYNHEHWRRECPCLQIGSVCAGN